MYAARRLRGARLVDGHHPARAGCRQRRRDRQPRRWRGATSAGPAPGSCRSAGTPACRVAPRWAPTPPRFPGGRRGERRQSPPRLAEQYGFPVGDRPGSPPRRWSRPAGAASSTSSTRRGGNFLDVLPDPAAVDERAGAGAGARAPGHRRVEPDARRSGRGRRAAPGGDALRAARRRHRDHHRAAHRVQPRDRRAAAGRGAQRVGDLRATSARRVDPDRAELMSFPSGQAIRDEIARVVPMYAGVEPLRTTGDAVQWGGTRLCEGGVFPTADGRAHFPAVAPSEPDVPHGQLRAEHPPGQAVQHDGARGARPAHRRDRDALFMAPADVDRARAARR